MTLPTHPFSIAAMLPMGDDAVDVNVEIAPLNRECLASCPVTEQPPALPVSGGEPLSLVLPLSLFVAGIVAAVWARRSSARV